MISFNILAVLACLILLIPLASISFVQAAEKIIDEDIDETTSYYTPNCGGGTAEVRFFGHITVWDNGHIQGNSIAKGVIVDENGEIIGRANAETPRQFHNENGVYVSQVSTTVTCEGSGQEQVQHIGVTVDTNGDVHFHSPNEEF